MNSAKQCTILIGTYMPVCILDVEAGGHEQQGRIEPSKLEMFVTFGDSCQAAIHGTIARELQTLVLLGVDDGNGFGLGLEVFCCPSNVTVELLFLEQLVETIGIRSEERRVGKE